MKKFLLGMSLVVIAGCSDADAPEKCEELVSVQCDKCTEDSFFTKEACLDLAEAALDCSKAYAIEDSYDTCLQKLEASECGAEQPSECEGVIVMSE